MGSFIIVRAINTTVLLVALVAGWRTVHKLRRSTDVYKGRLLPFAYYSMTAWALWIISYCLIILIGTHGATSGPWQLNEHGFGIVFRVVRWLSLVQAGFLVAAAAVLYFRKPGPLSVGMSSVLWWAVTAGLFVFGTQYYRADQVWLVDAIVSPCAFWAFIPGFRRLRAHWVLTLPFAIYGFAQIPLFVFHPPQPAFFITMTIVLPFFRVALLLAWIRFFAVLVRMGEATLTLARKDMAQVASPECLRRVFQVMISSTVSDLGSERDAVDRAIESLTLESFRSEKMGSLPYPPRAVCEFMSRTCDMFILVIGTTYGYIMPHEGMSAVEYEYNVARNDDPGKVLVYVKNATTREPREEQFLRAVEDFDHGYFRSTFDTPEQLFDYVRRDIARWLAGRVGRVSHSAT